MDYEKTYNTIATVYKKLNELGISAYMVGGILVAVQTNIDLYRQNKDIDLMVAKEDLDNLILALSEIGYVVEDKRGNLTRNYVDLDGIFHSRDHELNANTANSDILGIGIFVYERKDGHVITNSYAYREKEQCFICFQNVMPQELFDLMYSSEAIEYKGTKVKCQSKEFTYLSKSQGNRDKDKLDASMIEPYIGEAESKRVERIKILQNIVVRYKIEYDKDGNIISSKKMPGLEEKIETFIANIVAKNEGASEDAIKKWVLSNEFVKQKMEQDSVLKAIMEIWANTPANGKLAEAAKRIAHDYCYNELIDNIARDVRVSDDTQIDFD